MAPKSKAELNFIKNVKAFKDQVYLYNDESVQEGFDYFDSEDFGRRNPRYKSRIKAMLFSNGIRHFLAMVKIFWKYFRSIMRERKKCFTDLDADVNELYDKGKIEKNKKLLNSYPNNDIWQELKKYAWDNWQVKMGFTELSNSLIFKGKAVLYKYAVICIQEMEKEKIDKAPGLEAGQEVQRIYNSLGIAVNNIAVWLRKKYKIKCQSNHPLVVVAQPLRKMLHHYI